MIRRKLQPLYRWSFLLKSNGCLEGLWKKSVLQDTFLRRLIQDVLQATFFSADYIKCAHATAVNISAPLNFVSACQSSALFLICSAHPLESSALIDKTPAETALTSARSCIWR